MCASPLAACCATAWPTPPGITYRSVTVWCVATYAMCVVDMAGPLVAQLVGTWVNSGGLGVAGPVGTGGWRDDILLVNHNRQKSLTSHRQVTSGSRLILCKLRSLGALPNAGRFQACSTVLPAVALLPCQLRAVPAVPCCCEAEMPLAAAQLGYAAAAWIHMLWLPACCTCAPTGIGGLLRHAMMRFGSDAMRCYR
jgi:hypothetical protein